MQFVLFAVKTNSCILSHSCHPYRYWTVNIEKALCSCIVWKLLVMHQVLLQINLSILSIDTEHISRKAISHYLNNWVTNQNIRYLLEILHFGTRLCQALRMNSKNLLYSNLASVIFYILPKESISKLWKIFFYVL